MAIYSPVALVPNNTAILHTANNVFTWENSGDVQTHYQIKIYKNSDNSLIYDSTKLASSNPQHTLTSGTLSNAETCKWQVTAYSNLLSAKSSWYLFYTASLPTVTISSTPSNNQTWTFDAIYSSAQNIPVKTYRYYLYNASTPTVAIGDSGELYPITLVTNSSTPLTHTFDGMLSEQTYSVKCVVVNQQDVTVESGLSTFTVNYNYPPPIPKLTVTPDNEFGIMRLNWSKLKQILPVVGGTQDYDYVQGKWNYGIKVNVGTTITYTEPIPEDYTLYFWVKFPTGYTGDVLKFNKNTNTGMRIFFTGNQFGFELDNVITIGRMIETLHPSDTLAPSDTLFMTGGNILENWVILGIKHGELLIKGEDFEEILTL